MYEECSNVGRADIIRELLSLGASHDVDWATGKKGDHKNDEEHDSQDDKKLPRAHMHPALHDSAMLGHLDCVKVLIEEANIDVNLKDSDLDTTALTNAFAKGHSDVVDYLLAHNAQITFSRDSDERMTDPQAAVNSGNVEIVKTLLANPQSVAQDLKIGASLLFHATNSTSPEMVEFVLQSGDFPTASLSTSSTELDLPSLTSEQRCAVVESIPAAIKHRMLDTLQLLLSYITRRRPDGTFDYIKLEDDQDHVLAFERTVDAMVGANDIPVLFKLVWETLLCPPQAQLDSSQDARTEHTQQITRYMMAACCEGCPETAKLILEQYGAHVNLLSPILKSTPLRGAVESNLNPLPPRLEIAKYLLEQPNIDIHLAAEGAYSNGPTAMARAVLAGWNQPSMVKLLLEHGGPVEQVDSALTEQAKAAEPDISMSLCVVVFPNEPRFPVRLTTIEKNSQLPSDQDIATVELDMEAQELVRLIENVQIRKEDSLLAANDPEQRPLKQAED